MAHTKHRVSEWMGLNRGDLSSGASAEEDPGRPGPTPVRRYVIAAAWVVVAAALFFVLQARMPDADGVGGFAPLYIAVLSGAIGLTWTGNASSTPHR